MIEYDFTMTPLIEEKHERVNLLRKAALDEAQFWIFRQDGAPATLKALFNVLRMEEEEFHDLLVNSTLLTGD